MRSRYVLQKQVSPKITPLPGRSNQSPSYSFKLTQVAALCGVHCINTLLQGSVFTEMDLASVENTCTSAAWPTHYTCCSEIACCQSAVGQILVALPDKHISYYQLPPFQIALELDEMERRVMLEAGATSDEFLRYAAEESSNVANDGMFSIQVLQKALEALGLSVIPLEHPDVRNAKAEPESESAFICNLQASGLPSRVSMLWFWNESLVNEEIY